MARTRLINPAASVDEDIATMSMAARIVWAYLPCHADRSGRLRDSPFSLKLLILPNDNVDMDGILGELAERRHIVRYIGIDGRSYIQIRNFARYQKPHKNEAPSEIPANEGTTETDIIASLREEYGTARVKVGIARAVSDPDPVSDPVSSLSPSPVLSASGSGRAIPAPPSTGIPAAFRPPHRPYPVGAATIAFLSVFNRYPNQNAKAAAAGVWQELTESHPGGEPELARAIAERFNAGFLNRHPYAGEAKYRPTFEKFLAERRWEDPDSKPDDPPQARGSPRAADPYANVPRYTASGLVKT